MAYQTTRTLPNDVAQIAVAHQLGQFSQVYVVARRLRAMMGGCLITFSIIPCIVFSSLLRNGVAVSGWIVLLLVVCAIVFGTLGYMLQNPQPGVSAAYLFENGIVYSQGGQHTPLPWSQIDSCEIGQGSKRGIVRTKDGRTVTLGNLARYKELGTRIKNSIEPH